MTLLELLKENGNDLSNHDLAALADWAGTRKYQSEDPEWKRAYALLREGSDLLLRRRVRQNGDKDGGPTIARKTEEPGTQMGDGRVRFPLSQPVATTKGTL